MFVGALLLALWCNRVEAQTARLSLQTATGQEQAQIGDTLEVQILVDPRGASLTSVSVYVSFDQEVFTLVPDQTLGDGTVLPFRSGTFMPGQIYANSTAGDTIGAAVGNGLDGFQLDYVAVSGSGFVGDRQVAADPGVLASFEVALVGYPERDVAAIKLDDSGRRRSIYTEVSTPGVEANFQSPLAPLQLQVSGEGIRPLEDLQITPGSGVQLDLGSHHVGKDRSVGEIRWEFILVSGSRIRTEVVGQILRLRTEADFEVVEKVEYVAMLPDGRSFNGAFSVDVSKSDGLLSERHITLTEDAGVVVISLEEFLAAGVELEGGAKWTAVTGGRIGLELSERDLRLQLPPDWHGFEEITLAVVDGNGRGDTVAILIEVLAVNDPPEVAEVKTQVVAAGGMIQGPELEDLITDQDDPFESLEIAIEARGEIRVQQRRGYLWLSGLNPGAGEVVVSVVDAAGARASGAFDVVVISLSGPPALAGLPLVELERGAAIELRLNEFVTDGDTSVEQLRWFVAARGPVTAELRQEDGRPVLRIVAVTSGTAQVALQVSDAEGNSAAGTIVVEVAAVKLVSTDSTLVRTGVSIGSARGPVVYPNPFNSQAAISYQLGEDSWVQLVIYDVQGRRMRTLIDNSQLAGYNTAVWDGRGEDGRDLPSGTYFYQVRTKRQRWSGKMMLVR